MIEAMKRYALFLFLAATAFARPIEQTVRHADPGILQAFMMSFQRWILFHYFAINAWAARLFN